MPLKPEDNCFPHEPCSHRECAKENSFTDTRMSEEFYLNCQVFISIEARKPQTKESDPTSPQPISEIEEFFTTLYFENVSTYRKVNRID